MEPATSASIGVVGTYPPTVCGIATYTASLVQGIAARSSAPVGVVRLADEPGLGPPVDFTHRRGDRASLRAAIRTLDAYDTVSVQHEFGIFGGPDGDEVVDLMAALTVPTAVTLHTVLTHPTPHQRAIVDRICDLAARVVVMSETASVRLTGRYGVDPARIRVIPHGVHPEFSRPSLTTGARPLVLTWGLIGPGKGLEWAIQAFANLVDTHPRPRYLIAGATHPEILRQTGETYRHGLMSLAADLALDDLVEFDPQYRDTGQLARLVRSADAIVLPYESVEQVTSGVLVEAIAAGKPVVATRFPHAVELLAGGAGMLVPYGRPDVLGEALRRLLADPASRARMASRSRQLSAGWSWPTVGGRFSAMMSELGHPQQVPAHFAALP